MPLGTYITIGTPDLGVPPTPVGGPAPLEESRGEGGEELPGGAAFSVISAVPTTKQKSPFNNNTTVARVYVRYTKYINVFGAKLRWCKQIRLERHLLTFILPSNYKHYSRYHS